MKRVRINAFEVEEGDIFVAIGDTHNNIETAINRGASSVICEYGDYDGKTIIVDNSKRYFETIINNFCTDFISNCITVGILGDNATRTALFTNELFQRLNHNSEILNENSSFDLYNKLFNMQSKGINSLIIELKNNSNLFAYQNVKYDVLALNGAKYNYNYWSMMKEKGTIIANDMDFIRKPGIKMVGYNSYDYRLVDHKINEYDTDIIFERNNFIPYAVSLNVTKTTDVYNALTSIAILNSLNNKMNVILDASTEIHLPNERRVVDNNNKNIIIDQSNNISELKDIFGKISKYDKLIVLYNGTNLEMQKYISDNAYSCIFTCEQGQKLNKSIIYDYLTNNNYFVNENKDIILRNVIDNQALYSRLLILNYDNQEVLNYVDPAKTLTLQKQ